MVPKCRDPALRPMQSQCGRSAGRYEVDKYSRVEVTSAVNVCDFRVMLRDRIPVISLSSDVHDLVTVSGLLLITPVDIVAM